MASLAQNLIAYLRTVDKVTAEVGTGNNARIFKRRPKQGTTLPFIVLETFEGSSSEDLQGPTGLAQNRMQIDCYAATETDAFALAELVRFAPLQGRGNFIMGALDVRDVSSLGGYRDGDDPPPRGAGANRFWVSRDYEFSYRESTS